MNKCDCYFEHRYLQNTAHEYSRGFCKEAKNDNECSCKGNKSKCDFYPEIRKKALMQTACEFGRWIDVKDALPEIHQAVIVYDDYYNEVSSSYLTAFNDWYEMPKDSRITHWVHLPKPPCQPTSPNYF